MTSNEHYEKLMALPGLDELKETIGKWNKILHNLKSKNIDAPLLIPNLFLKTEPGVGKTYFFRVLCDYLDKAGFMDFYGDVKFFEFYLEYVPSAAHMFELNRLIEQIRNAAGFRNEYRGLVVVDITDWADRTEEDNFIKVLEYLSAIDSKVFIIFTADSFTEQQIEKAEKVLNAYCRIRTVAFPYPSKIAFAAYCAKRLKKYKINLDQGAQDLLCASIEKLMESEHFYGYKTVDLLCLDVAFELSSSLDIHGETITAEHLEAFSKDSVFIERLYSAAKIRHIGFGGGI